MIKVFTKYDTPFTCMHEARVRDVVAQKWSNDMVISFEPCTEVIKLHITKVEEGLEGVRFFTYEEL